MSEERKNSGPVSLALVPRSEPSMGVSGGIAINGFADMERMASMLSQAAGIVPRAYAGNPAAVAAIIMTGFELGIAPMTAMRELHLIEGKVSLSATLMLTLARRAGVKTRWLVTNASVATIGVTAPGLAEQTMSFTETDAKTAGLWGKGNWGKHPAAMLRARATSAAIRAFCPEAIGGNVYESESGEVTDGLPAGTITVSSITTTAPNATVVHAGPPIQISQCSTPEELHEWCATYGVKAERSARSEALVSKHAKRVGVDARAMLDACGWLAPIVEAPHDPETGEVLSEHEPA